MISPGAFLPIFVIPYRNWHILIYVSCRANNELLATFFGRRSTNLMIVTVFCSLAATGLKGPIPGDIGKLAALEHLDLRKFWYSCALLWYYLLSIPHFPSIFIRQTIIHFSPVGYQQKIWRNLHFSICVSIKNLYLPTVSYFYPNLDPLIWSQHPIHFTGNVNYSGSIPSRPNLTVLTWVSVQNLLPMKCQ